MVEAKAAARQTTGDIANPAMHSSDTQAEAISLLQILLNDNSVRFLNTAHHFPPSLRLRLQPVQKWLIERGISVDNMVVDSSGVLEAYGSPLPLWCGDYS